MLSDCLYANPITHQYFAGVVASEDLTNCVFSTPFSIVINILAPGKFGHFVSFFCTHDICYFVDSMGKSAAYYQLTEFVNSFHVPLVQNNIQLQSSSSCTCPLFCAYFLFGLSRQQHSLSDIVSVFNTVDLKSNDSFLLRWFVQVFHVSLKRSQIRRLLTCDG